jgi:hypothetical protein
MSLTPFTSERAPTEILLSRAARIPTFSLNSCLLHKPARVAMRNLFDMSHILKSSWNAYNGLSGVTKETQQASREGRLSLRCRTGPLCVLWHAATAVLDWTRVLRLELYERTNCPSTPLASVRSDAGGRRCVLGIASATFLRPELALALSYRAFADSHRRFRSPRSSQCDSDSYIHRQYHHHRRHDRFLNSFGHRDSATSLDAESTAAFGERTLDREYSRLRTLVLEARRRRSAAARASARPHG